MKPKRAVKELEKQLRKDPDNLVLRLRLAAALRELGRTDQAVQLYRSVAVQYHADGRLAQAIAVCKSVLELEPSQRETQALLAELESMQRAGAADADAAPPPFAAPPSAPPFAAPPSAAPPPEEVPSVDSGRSASVRIRAAPLRRASRPSNPTGEFGRRSGMTPVDEDALDVPSLARVEPRRKSDPALRRSRPPGVPASRPTPRPHSRPSDSLVGESTLESSREPRYSGPMRRTSGPLITPTPLPPPMVDPDVDEEAMTTVAPESGWRPPDMPLPGSAAVPEPPPPPEAPTPTPVPIRRQVPPPPTPRPPSADPFDEATVLGDSLAEVDPALLQATHRRPPIEAPPEPPSDKAPRITARLGSRGSEHARASSVSDPAARETDPLLGRARDAAATDLDEVTDVRDPVAGGARSFDAEEREVTRPEDMEVTQRKARLSQIEIVDDEEEDEETLHLESMFHRPRPYSETLQSLAPDGSAIDTPLTIFSELPDEALSELVRRMSLRGFSAADIVLREGDPGDACFIIASGSVRVLKRDPANERSDLIEVARLGAGAIFGEFALLADRRRHATVQAVENCELYEIPRRLLRELAATYSEVGPALERFYRERLLSTLLTTAPFFGPLAEERRSELLARFEPMRCESGERVINEGERAGGLYLIVLGSVEITKRVAERRSVLLTTLGEGSYFGEMSLMRDGAARASVTATGPTELAMLPANDFYDVVAQNPVLWEEIRREAHRRELMLNQIVTGETGVV